MQIVPITEEIFIARQPSEQQLANYSLSALPPSSTSARQMSTVCLVDCADTPAFLQNESSLVESAGLTYVHLPVKTGDIDAAYVHQAILLLSTLPKPCLLHCSSGIRSVIVALLKVLVPVDLTDEEAKEHASSPLDVLAWGEGLGYHLANDPRVYNFVYEYMAS